MTTKSLTRSRSDKFLGGICGGIAAYTGLDSGLVRIIAVVLAVFTQVGWVAYLVLWAVLPLEGGGPTGFDEAKTMFGGGRRGPDAPTQNPDDLR
jgi:phage shock protein C